MDDYTLEPVDFQPNFEPQPQNLGSNPVSSVINQRPVLQISPQGAMIPALPTSPQDSISNAVVPYILAGGRAAVNPELRAYEQSRQDRQSLEPVDYQPQFTDPMSGATVPQMQQAVSAAGRVAGQLNPISPAYGGTREPLPLPEDLHTLGNPVRDVAEQRAVLQMDPLSLGIGQGPGALGGGVARTNESGLRGDVGTGGVAEAPPAAGTVSPALDNALVATARLKAQQAAQGRQPLEGLPQEPIKSAGYYVPGPMGFVHDIAEQYMQDAGLPYNPPKTYAKLDRTRAENIAQEFDDMRHAPDDPAVQASYQAMAQETLAQYQALKNSGIKFDFIQPGMKDPYAATPRLAAKDVLDNQHLWVYPSDTGFGANTGAVSGGSGHPMLQPSGETINGKEVPYNDLFRIVHDVFGHFKDGNGFRAEGEENAWRSHSAMYSDLARPAMTAETRGQNSWVNFGPHGEANRTASAADTVYADQKMGMLPDWVVNEGRYDPLPQEAINAPAVQRGITDPLRNDYPGIYRDPRVIAREAAENVAQEHPALFQLFGVHREDLADIGQYGTREGNMAPQIAMRQNPRGSYAANAIMNPENAQRLIDALGEAGKYPQLTTGMDAWYVMDPAYQRMAQLVGPEQAQRDYNRFNIRTSMHSPGSNVETEINRGTTANMLINQGRFMDWRLYGGKEGGIDPDVMGHPYHSTAHVGPLSRYLKSGEEGYGGVNMTQPKVPLYMQASGVPETGFQTTLPVPDAHFTRGVGMADVRNNANPGASMKTPEYAALGPWYRENVAKPLGLQAVPAQARQWGLFAKDTGVDTQIGAPKLEILAKKIWERAQRLGVDPRVLRDQVLTGQGHAQLETGASVA